MDVAIDICRGQGCGRATDRGYMVDGVCPGCAEHEAACEHCGVVCDRAAMTRVDPSDLVCVECGTAAKLELEASCNIARPPVWWTEWCAWCVQHGDMYATNATLRASFDLTWTNAEASDQAAREVLRRMIDRSRATPQELAWADEAMTGSFQPLRPWATAPLRRLADIVSASRCRGWTRIDMGVKSEVLVAEMFAATLEACRG